MTQHGAIRQGRPGPHPRFVQARIRPELHQWLQKYAHDHAMSLSLIVAQALEQWREDKGKGSN